MTRERVNLSELSRFLEHPQAIPSEGVFTGFLGPDELSEWLVRFAERRMLAGVFGGYRMPRRVMLRVVPPGKAPIVASRLREEVPRLLGEWDELAETFPARWLRMSVPAESPAADQARKVGSWVRMLASQGVHPGWLGDFLAGSSGAFLLVDSRRRMDVRDAFDRLTIEMSEVAGKLDGGDFARQATVFLRSPRLDALVGKAFGMGREEAKKAVSKGFVAVNLLTVTNASTALSAGDLVDFELGGRALVQAALLRQGKSRYRVLLTVLENAHLGW